MLPPLYDSNLLLFVDDFNDGDDEQGINPNTMIAHHIDLNTKLNQMEAMIFMFLHVKHRQEADKLARWVLLGFSPLRGEIETNNLLKLLF